MESGFKVIVVGGGPVGLIAAHALHLANIDFIVLERRPAIVEDKGASLVVYPHTFRVLHQIGILEQVLSVGGELKHHLSFTADGTAFNESPRYQKIRESSYGYGPTAFHRAELIKIIYDGLPATAKKKVLTSKSVQSIETSETGVKLSCNDGTSYLGSIVIGADGVHSKTRRTMREIALKEDPLRSWDPEQPFTSTFRLLFGGFPAPSESGQGYDVQSQNKAIMYFSGPKLAWFFLYEKLPQPTRERVDYSEEEVEELGREFAEFPLTRTVKVKDVWPKLIGKGMTDMQEGVLQHWSLGRLVLVGDACHKFTTHLGQGFNNGVQDIVVLCNGIQKAVKDSTGNNPDISALAKVFEDYASLRKSSASSLFADFVHSGMETRMHTWSNPFYWLISRYLTLPRWVDNLLFKRAIGSELLKGEVLEYVEKDEPMQGKIGWLHPMSRAIRE
ncbi:hypothetical protein N7528_003370 [Penicillium herquei]|nr:hypothetical protein N7528_003370 [Penicillium herquei]